MIIALLRMFLVLSEAQHEQAHCACEIVVYAFVAPDTVDDALTPTGEIVSEILCRNDEF